MIQAAKRRDETLRRQFIARARARLPRRPRAGADDRVRLVPEPVRPGARRSAGRGAAARPRAALDRHDLSPRRDASRTSEATAGLHACVTQRSADRSERVAATDQVRVAMRMTWPISRCRRRLAVLRFASPPSGASAGCAWPRWRSRSRRSCCASPPPTTTSRFARLIDARLHGERETRAAARLRAAARAAPRPVLTDRQLVDRLNDLGYAQRDHARKARRVRDRQRRDRDHAARAGAEGPGRPRRVPAAAGARRADAPRRRRAAAAAARSRPSGSSSARRPSERLIARRAGADRAHQRRARKAAAGRAVRDPRSA